MLYKKIDFDCECAIELFTACNYHCDYCSGPRAKKLVRRGRTPEDVDQVIRFFNDSGKKWLIGMSGGEPTVHPFFGDLVSGLNKQHSFYFFTNLTFEVESFMKLVPADQVQYMKTSLHPEADVETFLEKYELLFGFGYNPILIMVSAPDTFDRIKQVSDFCQARQYPFTLSVMEGPYQDKNYPNDYSEPEERFIEEHTAEAGNLIRLFSKTPGGLNTFGLSCPAGHQSFVLDLESGNVFSCESVNHIHGNIYQGTFSPSSQDITCPAVNGCVGYDRSPFLPGAYKDFFTEGWNYWHLKDVKSDPDYPNNLHQTIQANQKASGEMIEAALEAIHQRISGTDTLFWGAGIYGAKVLYNFQKRFPDASNGNSAGNVIGFIDSLKDRRKVTVLGLPVYSPQDGIVNRAKKILITSYAFERDILEVARKLGVKSEVIALHRDILSPIGIRYAIF